MQVGSSDDEAERYKRRKKGFTIVAALLYLREPAPEVKKCRGSVEQVTRRFRLLPYKLQLKRHKHLLHTCRECKLPSLLATPEPTSA